MKQLLVILVSMFSLLSFAQEKNNRPSSYNYRRGVEAIQNHNTDEALDYLNKEIEKIQKMAMLILGLQWYDCSRTDSENR